LRYAPLHLRRCLPGHANLAGFQWREGKIIGPGWSLVGIERAAQTLSQPHPESRLPLHDHLTRVIRLLKPGVAVDPIARRLLRVEQLADAVVVHTLFQEGGSRRDPQSGPPIDSRDTPRAKARILHHVRRP